MHKQTFCCWHFGSKFFTKCCNLCVDALRHWAGNDSPLCESWPSDKVFTTMHIIVATVVDSCRSYMQDLTWGWAALHISDNVSNVSCGTCSNLHKDQPMQLPMCMLLSITNQHNHALQCAACVTDWSVVNWSLVCMSGPGHLLFTPRRMSRRFLPLFVPA